MRLSDLPAWARLGLRAAAYLAGADRRPFMAAWALSYRCNLRCRYCGAPGLPATELAGPELLALLDGYLAGGLRYVSLTGGEPLLSPHFEAFTGRARAGGAVVAVNTNGLLIAEKLEALARCQRVGVSLDGPPAVNALARGGGARETEAALAGAAMLAARGVAVTLNCVASKANLGSLEEVCRMAAAAGAKAVFQPCSPVNIDFSPSALALSAVERLRFCDTLSGLKRKYPRVVGNKSGQISDWRAGRSPAGCQAGRIYFRITPDGGVRVCGRLPEPARPFAPAQLRAGCFDGFADRRGCEGCTAAAAHAFRLS